MASKSVSALSFGHETPQSLDLLLRETMHRASNDLQMVVGFLALQSRRANSPAVRQALTDAMERVSVLAGARQEMASNSNLSGALEKICAALRPQAEVRSIAISLHTEQEAGGLPATQIMTIALVVNELATNAIKHAFKDSGNGAIFVTETTNETGDIVVLIGDDGLPFPDVSRASRNGLGLELARRLMVSIGGLFIPPRFGSKVFELRVPIDARP